MPTARAALVAGFSSLRARPWTLGAAVLAGAASALALAAANRGALRLLSLHHPGSAITLWLVGATLAALLGAGGLVATQSPDLADAARLPKALPRATAVLSLYAVERLIQGMLLVAAVAVFLAFTARFEHRSTTLYAAGFALSAACPLVVLMLLVPAFRIAVARTAAGELSWLALLHGLRLALVDFPSLVRLVGLVFLLTAPLYALTLALGRAEDHLGGGLELRVLLVLLVALRGGLVLLASALACAAYRAFTATTATTAMTDRSA